MADTEKLEDDSSYQGNPALLYQREIAAAKKELGKFWEDGAKINNRFLDEREGSQKGGTRYNLFWSNTNIITAQIYAKQPKADVSRRNKDQGDDVGRVAGLMIERILNMDMDSQTSDFDTAMRQCVQDRAIPGLGQVWLRYEPTMVKQQVPAQTDPQGAELEPAREVEVIGEEKVATDYVYWKDFLWSPARTWKEVRWVARGLYFTRAELIKKFGDVHGKAIPLKAGRGADKEGSSLSENDPWAKARLWEIWKKESRTVCWYAEGYDKIPKEEPDSLELDQFFPCPVPFVANVTTTSFVPKADYMMVRDQYVELDVVSARIALLEDAIKVVGVYNKTVGELGGMLSGSQNVMIAADNWAMFAEKGGIKGSVDWFPLDMVIQALLQLRETKSGLMQDLYNLIGISDIMRGASEASETLGAQQLKAQYGSVRQQNLQGGLAAFVQQTLAIKAEIMAAHFQPETLKRQSMIDSTPDAQLADQAVQRLKDKRLAHYSLTVDPDTMALADYAQEQAQRVACITAIGQFMQAATPLVQMKPEATPFLLQVLQWLLGAFKAGKQIEGVLDQAIAAVGQTAGAPDPMAEAMKQAQLKKVSSEGDKNQTAAVKNLADARAKHASVMQGGIDTLMGAAQGVHQMNQPPAPPGGPPDAA